MLWRLFQLIINIAYIQIICNSNASRQCSYPFPRPYFEDIDNSSVILISREIALKTLVSSIQSIAVFVFLNGQIIKSKKIKIQEPLRFPFTGIYRIDVITIDKNSLCVQSDSLFITAIEASSVVPLSHTSFRKCVEEKISSRHFDVTLLSTSRLESESFLALSQLSQIVDYPFSIGLLSLKLKKAFEVTGENEGLELYDQIIKNIPGFDEVYRQMNQSKQGEFVYVLIFEDLCPLFENDTYHIEALLNFITQTNVNVSRIHVRHTNNDFVHDSFEYEQQIDRTHSRRIWQNSVYINQFRKIVQPVLAYEMIHPVLHGDFFHFNFDSEGIKDIVNSILKNPDFNSDMENIWRIGILGPHLIRLFVLLPLSTQWYRFKITLEQLKECHIMKEDKWIGEFPECSTVKHASMHIQHSIDRYLKDSRACSLSNTLFNIHEMQQDFKRWEKEFVLIGATLEGSLTLWDGTRRALALSGLMASNASMEVTVYLGISPDFITQTIESYSYCKPEDILLQTEEKVIQ